MKTPPGASRTAIASLLLAALLAPLSPALATEDDACYVPPGDLNDDDQVNVLDAVTLVGIVLGNTVPATSLCIPCHEATSGTSWSNGSAPTGCLQAVGDLSQDDIVNVLDVVLLVNLMLNPTEVSSYLQQTSVCGACEGWTWEAEAGLLHDQGYEDGDGWACNTAAQSEGFMSFGPYTTDIPTGPHEVRFDLMIDIAPPGGRATDKVVTLDVFNAAAGNSLVNYPVYRADFAADMTYISITLPFEAAYGMSLEFRVWWHDVAYINLDKVVVTPTTGSCDDLNRCTVDSGDPSVECLHLERALVPCDDPPCAINNTCLYVMERDGLTDAEATLMASLQGLLSRQRSGLYFDLGHASLLSDLVGRYGVTLQPISDPWEILDRFASTTKSYVLMDLAGDPNSLSVGTSLAGALDGLMVDISIEPTLQSMEFELVEDARFKSEQWCFDTYESLFSTHILVEQREGSPLVDPLFLRDVAVAQRAFTYHPGLDQDFRTAVVAKTVQRGKEAGEAGQPLVLGWAAEVGGGEYLFVEGVTDGGGAVVPADYSANLSVLRHVDGTPLPMPLSQGKSEGMGNGHYVTFVLSDGDNLQWMQAGFKGPAWWGSPWRGQFPMTWAVALPMTELAPSVMALLSLEATPTDGFVGGPSGAGYTLPSMHPDIWGHAARTNTLAEATGVDIFTMIDSTYGGGGLEAAIPYLEQPHIRAVLYDSYGANDTPIIWHQGDVAMEYRHYLWAEQPDWAETPNSLAQKINNASTDAFYSLDAYSAIFVHCWSTWDLDGDGVNESNAMDAVAATISMLDPDVHVVTAGSFFDALQHQYNGPGCGNTTCDAGESCSSCEADCGPCTSWTWQAESDFGHQQGYPDGEGWACNTTDQTPNHMLFGPYATDLPAGAMEAIFHLMIDVPAPAGVADDVVVTLDIFDATKGEILAARVILREEFDEGWVNKAFALPFVADEGAILEFRVFWHATSYVNVDKVVLSAQ